ncbi:Hypothetical predicted protein, partial [Paramuricea clavata]
LAKRIATMNLAAVTSTPDVTPVQTKSAKSTAVWTLGCEAGPGSPSSEDDEILRTTWNDAKEDEKGICIDKAIEACSLVCDVMAPNAGRDPFQSCFTANKETNYSEFVPLMQAYSNATTKNVKTQILSLYAHQYPVKTLQKIHGPYAKLTEWQIKRARSHARESGPGSLVETSPCHRIRLQPVKLDHFLDFVNRPYFYQDVAFVMSELRLENGEKITMPNVIRKVREASQQKSLCGLDNTAVEGSGGFQRLHGIVD